jgi:hypothetical protein
MNRERPPHRQGQPRRYPRGYRRRETGCRHQLDVSLDLSAVPRCEPSLARTLAGARTQLRGHGGDLIVTGATEPVLTALATAVAQVPAAPGHYSDWPASLLDRLDTPIQG